MERKTLNLLKEKRKRRVRLSLKSGRPRLSVFRSNRHLWLQLIDDRKRKTVVSASTKELKSDKLTKTAQATAVGEALSKKAKEAGISEAAFDRGSYKYHGRVKAAVEALRQAGFKI